MDSLIGRPTPVAPPTHFIAVLSLYSAMDIVGIIVDWTQFHLIDSFTDTPISVAPPLGVDQMQFYLIDSFTSTPFSVVPPTISFAIFSPFRTREEVWMRYSLI